MRVSLIPPSKELAPYVRHFSIVETTEEVTRLLVPDGAMTLGFRFGGSATLLENGREQVLPEASFATQRSLARRMRTAAGSGIVLAMFEPLGVRQFFEQPFHEVFGTTLALDELAAASDIARAREAVCEAHDHRSRVAVVERFLLARKRNVDPDAHVEAAVRAIASLRGNVRVVTIAKQLGIHIDALEKRFRRAVGASPKQLASIVRLRHAVDSHRAGMNLAELALDAGYCDQSHFIRQFRAATGVSPRDFFSSGAHC
jgi:AraC-like DNA-binding protein